MLAQIADVKALVQNAIAEADTRPACYCFSVSKYGNYYGLWSKGSLVAILDKKTCGMISGLARDINRGTISIEAFIDIAKWSASISSGSKTITLDINVYGQQKNARQIGRVLNSVSISLQQPLFGLEGFVYYNPHFLHVDGIQGADIHATPLLHIELDDAEVSSSARDTTRVKTATIGAKKEVESILDSLSHHEILMKRNADSRMKTILLE
jgi:hypothetical protein